MRPSALAQSLPRKRASSRLRPILRRLYEARDELRAHFPDLKFTLDGNLIGDIGEAIAMQDFGLRKLPAGTRGHDFEAPDGRLVQVKTTQTVKGGVGLGLTKQSFEHLLVLQLTAEGDYRVLFDGPGSLIDEACTHLTSPSISLNRLRELDRQVHPSSRLVPAR